MINNFNEFVPLALRTESKLESVELNVKFVENLLNLQIVVGEMLDCLKKEVFYGKSTKMNEKFGSLLLEASLICHKLQQQHMSKHDGSLQKEINSEINPRLFHGILGIATESSELVQILVKHIGDPSAPIDSVNVAEELSDVSWYNALLVDELKIDHYKALNNVIEKLRVRYPEKFSGDLAENRNLEEERKKLEQV
jgi:NTP pyrophosphatase (non-canonical NTP hydrolase)